jgi:hypothetical protein
MYAFDEELWIPLCPAYEFDLSTAFKLTLLDRA